MSVKKEGKITFLKHVLESKEVLFGAFSQKLTKEDKLRKWKTIHEKALALGIVPANKDYLYTRDTYWQNLKKYTMKKIDNRRKTGSEGGPECKFTETDKLILDILGSDSPLVAGLPSAETWGNLPPSVEEKVSENQVDITGEAISESIEVNGKKTKSIHPISSNEECELREKKLKLSLEIMVKESYLKSLEILKMERELGLPKFTEMFPAQQILLVQTDIDTDVAVENEVNL